MGALSPGRPIERQPRAISDGGGRLAGAVGDRGMGQRQSLGRDDPDRARRLAMAGGDVEDHVVAGGSGLQSLAHRVFDRVQAVGQHHGQHPNEAPIGLVAAAELTPQPVSAGGNDQSWNGRRS